MSDRDIELGNEESAAAVTTPAVAKSRKVDRKTKRGRTILIVIIIILMLSLCAIAAVLARLVQPSTGEVAGREEAGGVEWVRSIYGWGPDKEQSFVRPLKVEVGNGGAIYISDQQYNFVMQFTPEGNLTRLIGDTTFPVLYRVGTIAEGDGQLFFGQTAQDRIRVFTAEGSEETSIPFPSPNDIEFSGDRLAVSSNVGFVVFNAAGEFVYEVGGEQGSGEDQFDVISGIAYGPDGTLYVTDAYNNRISAYDETGKRLWMVRTGDPGKGVDITNPAMAVGRETTAPAALQLPVDAVVDGNDRLVVVDGLDFSLSVFDTKDGKFIKKYGAYGSKDGQLLYPTSIDYDAERDWFVVADGGNRRVQILRLEDSAANGGGALSAARRALSGPLRALLFPLLLLILMAIAWFVSKRLQRRAAQKRALEASVAPVDSV